MNNKKLGKIVLTSALALSFAAPSLTAITPIIAQAEASSDNVEGYIYFQELLSLNSEEAVEVLSNLTLHLSEEQDFVINGDVPHTYNLSFGFGDELTVINDSESFSVTVASNVTNPLKVTLFNADTNSVIDEVTLNLSEAVQQVVSLMGEEPVERELVEAGISDEVDFLESQEDYATDYEQGSEVEALLEGASEELLEEYVPDSISSFSTFSTLNTPTTRTHQNGIYTVVAGDNFNTIATSFRLSKKQLHTWNGHISNINILAVGDKLAVTRAGYETQGLTQTQKNDLHKGTNPSQFANVGEFLDYLAPIAIEISSQPGEEALYPSLMLAQAIHESGVARTTVGMSQLSRPPYYNLSGIKARGNVPSVLMWTWEAVTDTYNEVKDKSTIAVEIPAYFQTFSSYNEALQRYANLLRVGRGTGEDFYYRGTWKSNTKDVWEVLDKGGLRGYATDPAYFAAIMRIINTYDLTQFDNATRISGENRFETAVSISREGWNSAETVVIADGFQYADALAGAPLAASLNSPILLSRQNKLDPATVNEIKRLGAKKAIILGGENALSSQVLNELKSLGLTTQRIAGKNRYATAGLIADELVKRTGTNQAILVSGEDFADAMSVAPFAASKGIPIYLTRTRALANEVKTASNQIKDWTIIGGSAAITGTVGRELERNIDSIRRIQGSNRYQTNQRVITHYGAAGDEVYLATGRDFADALTGSVLAGNRGTSILLVQNNDTTLKSQIQYAKNSGFTTITMLGGETALPGRIGESFRLQRLVTK